MKKTILRSAIALVALGLLASCMTVNELDTADLYGSRLAVRLITPPEPEVSVSYDVKFDAENPVMTVVSIGTNAAKAYAATQAEALMRSALVSIDLPNRIREETFIRCSDALGAKRVNGNSNAIPRDAEYLFDIDIRSYGIEAGSAAGAVRFKVSLVVSISDLDDGDLLWRRHIGISEPAHPSVFGLPDEVGSAVTIAVLAGMTEEEMLAGFEGITNEAIREISRRLERDLLEARQR